MNKSSIGRFRVKDKLRRGGEGARVEGPGMAAPSQRLPRIDSKNILRRKGSRSYGGSQDKKALSLGGSRR